MRLTFVAIIGLALIFSLNVILGWTFGWYLRFDWFDTLLHYLGGLFIALLLLSYYDSEFAKNSQPFQFFALLGMTMGIGVLWEFGEFIASQTLAQPFQNFFQIKAQFIGNLADTIEDLLMDTLGGLTVAGLHLLRRRNPQKR
ncbi:MAG: hypothetical protein COV31_03030 [Candidatus Yanofskybacteria bacterium CG10_big_fil_rev_8_21_14_0_10_46_23]|uniref:DUF2238 domain-containing protein n=1 Tax=Candidatus Yanofskybacteria bacterium CG10_big_fil_rev_8_21_14_0_10_46_23 TaxID=1975098 RepID=A0A2H0R3J7_9BACT|nr:MAG: hypothetical protein COV31_03030 [Candidatus Yanofskybacteria bacterium CG10_big_fil_rev_8_21_14_0_10_46_23]